MKCPTYPPIRRAKPVCVALDYDAVALLRAMCPNSKGMGLLVSELRVNRTRERKVS